MTTRAVTFKLFCYDRPHHLQKLEYKHSLPLSFFSHRMSADVTSKRQGAIYANFEEH